MQRVLRTIEPGPSHLKYQFGLIFKQRNDLDEARTRDTANEAEIEANLESLLERWRNVPSSCLRSETHKQEHIKKGCFKTESSPVTVDAACQSGHETTRNLELLIVEDINDVCTETVAQCIINVSVFAKDIINSLSTDNRDRSYHPDDLLLIADNPDGLSIHYICADDGDFRASGDL